MEELELELELLEELLLLLELALEFPVDLAPALELELAAAWRPSLKLPGRSSAMPASMGARPRAITISQRPRFIRSLRANGLRTAASTQSDAGRAQGPTTTRISHANRRSYTYPLPTHQREALCPQPEHSPTHAGVRTKFFESEDSRTVMHGQWSKATGSCGLAAAIFLLLASPEICQIVYKATNRKTHQGSRYVRNHGGVISITRPWTQTQLIARYPDGPIENLTKATV